MLTIMVWSDSEVIEYINRTISHDTGTCCPCSKNKLSTKTKEINECDLALKTHVPRKSHYFPIKLYTSETQFALNKQENQDAHIKEEISTCL